MVTINIFLDDELRTADKELKAELISKIEGIVTAIVDDTCKISFCDSTPSSRAFLAMYDVNAEKWKLLDLGLKLKTLMINFVNRVSEKPFKHDDVSVVSRGETRF